MSVTLQDVLRAAFVNEADLSGVEELTLAHKGLTDLGVLPDVVPGLCSLNLAFNGLTADGLARLHQLTCLDSINLRNNSLTNVPANFGSLPRLSRLVLSENKLKSIQGVAQCTALKELFVQGNRLRLQDLVPLSGLPNLSRLFIAKNPAAGDERSGSAQQARAAILALCPNLKVLDGVPVTADERAAVQHVDLQSLGLLTAAGGCELSERSSTGVSGRSSAPSHSTWGAATPLRASHDGADVAGRKPSHPGSPGDAHSSLRGAHSSGSAASTIPYGQEGSDGVWLGQAQPHVTVRATSMLQRSGQATSLRRNAAATAAAEACIAVQEASSPAAPSRGSRSTHASPDKATGGSGHAASRTPKRTAAGQDVMPRLRQLPASSAFQKVLAQLPQMDQSKLPPVYHPTGPPQARKAAPVPAPEDASTATYELKYGTGSRGRAVRAARDGSLCVHWPTGDLAVTVDADHAHCPPTYRLLALYRNTGAVAVSWDTAGGFVQYPSGGVCMVYNSTTGLGKLYGPEGEVLMKWDDAGPGGRRPHPSVVDMALDSHLGVRYSRTKQQMHVYMACEGVQYCAVCGFNSPGAVWCVEGGVAGEEGADIDPPPPFLHQLTVGGSAGRVQQALAAAATAEANHVPSSADAGFAAVHALLGSLNLNARG